VGAHRDWWWHLWVPMGRCQITSSAFTSPHHAVVRARGSPDETKHLTPAQGVAESAYRGTSNVQSPWRDSFVSPRQGGIYQAQSCRCRAASRWGVGRLPRRITATGATISVIRRRARAGLAGARGSWVGGRRRHRDTHRQRDCQRRADTHLGQLDAVPTRADRIYWRGVAGGRVGRCRPPTHTSRVFRGRGGGRRQRRLAAPDTAISAIP
jgi:hypothetical protein